MTHCGSDPGVHLTTFSSFLHLHLEPSAFDNNVGQKMHCQLLIFCSAVLHSVINALLIEGRNAQAVPQRQGGIVGIVGGKMGGWGCMGSLN